MTTLSFEELCVRVSEAGGPDEVFRALRAGGPGWREGVEAEVTEMRRVLDPARFDDEGARQGAAIVRRRLDELYGEAVGAAGGGEGQASYRQAAPLPSGAATTVRTARGLYALDGVLGRGDLSTVFAGRAVEGPWAGRELVAKVVDDAADNDLLLDEVAALEKLHAAGGPQRRHLPALVDHFRGPDGRSGVLLERLEGYDLIELRRRLPGGIPPRHVVWILRRLLAALGYAHGVGVLHGGIEPAHIVVRPRDHNVFLIDWSYSLIEPARTGRGFKVEIPRFSAPEVGQRGAPTPAADLFSLGRCAVVMLGGEAGSDVVPAGVGDPLVRFVRYLLRPGPRQRAQSAWEMFDELSRVRRQMFGPHTFEPFVV